MRAWAVALAVAGMFGTEPAKALVNPLLVVASSTTLDLATRIVAFSVTFNRPLDLTLDDANGAPRDGFDYTTVDPVTRQPAIRIDGFEVPYLLEGLLPVRNYEDFFLRGTIPFELDNAGTTFAFSAPLSLVSSSGNPPTYIETYYFGAWAGVNPGVPEPATWMLLLLGFGVVAYCATAPTKAPEDIAVP